MTDKPKTCLTDGSEVTPDHRDLKENGQQKDYVVLCPKDRANGYVRPLRSSYIHKGIRPQYETRELTDEEKERFPNSGYILFEEYPEASRQAAVGRFWTKEQLNSGCGELTIMARSIAETYARNPKFYGSTFCVGCRTHLPLDEFVWDGTDEVVGS